MGRYILVLLPDEVREAMRARPGTDWHGVMRSAVEAELAKPLNGWKSAGIHKLTVPGLDEERHLVELVRSDKRLDA